MPAPKLREASFQPARLCQFVDTVEDTWLPPSTWAAALAGVTRDSIYL